MMIVSKESNLLSCEPVSVSNCVILLSNEEVVDSISNNLVSLDAVYVFTEVSTSVICSEPDTTLAGSCSDELINPR